MHIWDSILRTIWVHRMQTVKQFSISTYIGKAEGPYILHIAASHQNFDWKTPFLAKKWYFWIEMVSMAKIAYFAKILAAKKETNMTLRFFRFGLFWWGNLIRMNSIWEDISECFQMNQIWMPISNLYGHRFKQILRIPKSKTPSAFSRRQPLYTRSLLIKFAQFSLLSSRNCSGVKP